MGFSEVRIEPSDTSYFSTPETHLDARLFMGNQLRPAVRNGIMRILMTYLAKRYVSPERWTKMWLAGSGISYQWSASRDPGDLDCLVGIDYMAFKKYNTEYMGLSNEEIAHMFNEDFNADIMPATKRWHGFELTYYVNPQSDIRDLNPYAAYSLDTDSWVVEPDITPAIPYTRAWEQKVDRDYETAVELLNRYSQALRELHGASNTAYRLNAERKLALVVDQAVAFYDDIHGGRKLAFSQIGAGYADFNNYRWQAGKRSGAVHALKEIKEYKDEMKKEAELSTYGVTLPDTQTLIRRAATKKA